MIIDFHTHSFPDRIAGKTVSLLAEKSGTKPFRDGTLSSLKCSMQASGIAYSVVLPVATSKNQVASINKLAFELNGKEGIIYAGAMHPDCDDVDGILDEIKEAGLFGIKIHPDYQNAFFDDERYLRIMESAAKRDLVTVTHAGLDVGYPETIRCTPDMILHALECLDGIIDNKLVLAHLGSFDNPDEVLEKLAGRNVYLDTAAVLDRYPEKAKELIQAHGFDKILFATDSPWSDQKAYVELLRSFGFSEENLEKIFSGNAKKLLNLSL